MTTKNFHGKAIYNPSGKAGEYSYCACNLYNGCEGNCTYCYNKKGIPAKVLGANVSTLKKSLVNEEKAYQIFQKEMFQNIDELRKHGLHFNFVGDPFLPKTIDLNTRCMRLCVINDIPVKTLSKQTWWMEKFLDKLEDDPIMYNKKHLFAFGWTLTGHDDLEPGCAPNLDRIRGIMLFSKEGFKTWASIEPIIDFESSFKMIAGTYGICDLYKIGLESGKKYDKQSSLTFISNVIARIDENNSKVYFKDSLLKAAGINRESLPSNCVSRDYNIFKN